MENNDNKEMTFDAKYQKIYSELCRDGNYPCQNCPIQNSCRTICSEWVVWFSGIWRSFQRQVGVVPSQKDEIFTKKHRKIFIFPVEK